MTKMEREFKDGFDAAQKKHAKTSTNKLINAVIPSSHGISARMFGWNAGLRTMRRERIAKDSYSIFLATAKRKLAAGAEKNSKVKKRMK